MFEFRGVNKAAASAATLAANTAVLRAFRYIARAVEFWREFIGLPNLGWILVFLTTRRDDTPALPRPSGLNVLFLRLSLIISSKLFRNNYLIIDFIVKSLTKMTQDSMSPRYTFKKMQILVISKNRNIQLCQI